MSCFEVVQFVFLLTLSWRLSWTISWTLSTPLRGLISVSEMIDFFSGKSQQ